MIRLSARVIQGAAKQLAQIQIAGGPATSGPTSAVTNFLLPQGCVRILAASYKSHLSIDNVYPNSNPDFLRNSENNIQENPTEFTGYIPVDQLQISYMKSSGPGGQNVNKVNSKVEMRFHLQTATWIPEQVKNKLGENELGRITKDGHFVVRSEATRKQLMNQADCMDKIRHLIFKSQADLKEPSEEQIQKKEQRIAKAKAGVLREKRKNQQNKRAMKASSNHPNF